MERLQKVIASRGYTSRRKAEELILAGKVYVNGKQVTELGVKVDNNAEIRIDNEYLQKEDKEYYVLNKPRGVISSVSDERGRKTVVDLIDTNARIYPIGRLDYDTTGIILLTNDGAFANKLMHPSFKIEKTYLAKLNKIFTLDDFYKLKKGIEIDNREVKINRLKIKSKDIEKNTSLVEISIFEGRNHIIKRIFLKLGYDVVKLKRLSYGFLSLGKLKSGEYRKLSKEEIKEFINANKKAT